MTYDNTGIISKNDRKQSDNHPDINGQATVEGKEYWINGWHKQRNNKNFRRCFDRRPGVSKIAIKLCRCQPLLQW